MEYRLNQFIYLEDGPAPSSGPNTPSSRPSARALQGIRALAQRDLVLALFNGIFRSDSREAVRERFSTWSDEDFNALARTIGAPDWIVHTSVHMRNEAVSTD